MAEAPLRVLIVSSRYPDRHRPFLGHFAEQAALGLAARPGVEVEVVAPLAFSPLPFSLRARSRRLRALPESETWNSIRVSRPHYSGWPGGHRQAARSLTRCLAARLADVRQRFPFDIVAAQFFWPEGPGTVAAAHALRVPVSVKARGIDFDRWERYRGAPLADLGGADGFLAVSDELRERMAALGLPRDRITVHRTGLDHRLFAPGDRSAAKAALGIDGPMVLAAGNLLPNKNHALAIDAVSRLPGTTLLIAGGGPEHARLEQQARRLGIEGRVRLLGPVPHERMPDLYRAADVTLHTSLHEGLSNVWIESLACGTPVVSTPAGAASEVLTGLSGCHVVEADADALARALTASLAARPGAEDLARSAVQYSWSAHVDALEDHLRQLAAARPGAPAA